MKKRLILLTLALALLLALALPGVASAARPVAPAITASSIWSFDFTSGGFNGYTATLTFTGKPAYWTYYCHLSDGTAQASNLMKLSAAEKKAGLARASFGVQEPKTITSMVFTIYDRKGLELDVYTYPPS